MHRLLARQLRKLGLNSGVPDQESWEQFKELVAETYDSADKDRYILERSLEISSEEMTALYQRQKSSYEARLHAILHAMPDVTFLFDEDGRYLEVMSGVQENLALPKEELKGKLIHDVFPADIADYFVETIRRSIDTGGLVVIEYSMDLGGAARWFEGRVLPASLSVDGKQTVVFLAIDITELKRSREELGYVATHDSLTGLPNRVLFQDRLQQAVTRTQRQGSKGALLFLDLDRFKVVNDTLGHLVGDKLLRQVGERLQAACRDTDTLARIGGDEFTLIVEDASNYEDFVGIAEKMLEVFSFPFAIEKYQLDISVSIGLSVFPQDGNEPEELIKHADTAMFAAKDAGRNTYRFYTQDLTDKAFEFFAMELSLQSALENNEFFLEYQPQYSLQTGKMVGVEALIRWQHPEKGLLSPAYFIGVAETTGHIHAIGRWVIREACNQQKAWREQGLADVTVAVNLSRKQLVLPDLVETVDAILADTGVDGNWLEFEITESAILEHNSIAHRNLDALHRKGIGLALDDFGTGYSSLVNLKQFPLSRIKIDRSFIRDVTRDANDEAIIRAIIALGDSFGLEVVAEGVETLEQRNFLMHEGCHQVQGFLYARPMPADAIVDHVHARISGDGAL